MAWGGFHPLKNPFCLAEGSPMVSESIAVNDTSCAPRCHTAGAASPIPWNLFSVSEAKGRRTKRPVAVGANRAAVER